MTAAVSKEIPPLADLVRHASLKETLDFVPSLSLPGVLLVGAKPFDRKARPASELKQFGEVARVKLRELERMRHKIFYAIVAGLYQHGQDLRQHPVTDYLGMYEFLVWTSILPPELEKLLDKDIKREIRAYRDIVPIYRMGNTGRTPPNIRELRNLEQTPVNLVYHHHQEYDEREPHLIVSKTKAPVRIAGKITYKMLEEYRDRDGKVKGTEFRRYLDVTDGVIRDVAGLQFVCINKNELARIKSFIFMSPDMEVMTNRKGEFSDDYYAKREGLYHALHQDVTWNPQAKAAPQIFNPHVIAVEVILLEVPYFYDSNFGPNSYWRRMNAQENGIVQKSFKDGRRRIDPFTPEELAWKQMVQARIMGILNYTGTGQRSL